MIRGLRFEGQVVQRRFLARSSLEMTAGFCFKSQVVPEMIERTTLSFRTAWVGIVCWEQVRPAWCRAGPPNYGRVKISSESESAPGKETAGGAGAALEVPARLRHSGRSRSFLTRNDNRVVLWRAGGALEGSLLHQTSRGIKFSSLFHGIISVPLLLF